MDLFICGAFVVVTLSYLINTIWDIKERKEMSESFTELYMRTQGEIWNLQMEIRQLKDKLTKE